MAMIKKAFMNAVEREAERMYDVYCPERFRFECELDSPADLYQATHGTTTLTFVESSQGIFLSAKFQYWAGRRQLL